MGDLMTEQTSVTEQSSGMAIASMVCGICSLVLFFFFGIVLAIVAVTLGHIHLSNIKKEPDWLLQWRLKAFERLKVLKEPDWQKPKYPKIDYQDLYYYSAPKSFKEKPKNLDDLDPKLLETYKKLGIPLQEQKRLNGIAVDAVFDSVSVATTLNDT